MSNTDIGNLLINTEDLKKVRPDIEVYLFEGQTDFSDQIEAANREEYRHISKQLRTEHPDYTEAEIGELIEKIKDHNVDRSLYDRRVLFALSLIFSGNNQLDEADYYRSRAMDVPLRYYIDENEDGVQDSEELHNLEPHAITFGR